MKLRQPRRRPRARQPVMPRAHLNTRCYSERTRLASVSRFSFERQSMPSHHPFRYNDRHSRGRYERDMEMASLTGTGDVGAKATFPGNNDNDLKDKWQKSSCSPVTALESVFVFARLAWVFILAWQLCRHHEFKLGME